MNTRTRKITIVISISLLVAFLLLAFYHFHQGAKEVRSAAKQEVHEVGDKITEKIDNGAAIVKEDYTKAKETAAKGVTAAKDKYEAWKKKREEKNTEPEKAPE